MSIQNKPSRVLGVAFLLQFVTSFFLSGVFLKPAWLVSGDIRATMLNVADRPWLLQANILVDMLTALGVIFLGVALFTTLRRQGEKTARVALGFYILEAGLLAASKMAAFVFLRLSQEYALAGGPESLLAFGSLALETMDFVGDTLHMLAFCLGAILFYALLYRSRLLPRPLSLWGLVTILPLLLGTLTAMFDVHLPFIVFAPYVPFEFVVGLWITIKGIPQTGA